MAVEDLVVIKALFHRESTSRHWFDALALLSSCQVDWDYVLLRAKRRGARRMLSLLLYAQSIDIVVPERAVRELYRFIFEDDTETDTD